MSANHKDRGAVVLAGGSFQYSPIQQSSVAHLTLHQPRAGAAALFQPKNGMGGERARRRHGASVHHHKTMTCTKTLFYYDESDLMAP